MLSKKSMTKVSLKIRRHVNLSLFELDHCKTKHISNAQKKFFVLTYMKFFFLKILGCKDINFFLIFALKGFFRSRQQVGHDEGAAADVESILFIELLLQL